MAVSIDKVYQTVLALANKEQRGYITPQEFNLFADHAQMEIFEQYFYDLEQFSRTPGTQLIYADKIKNLREKTDLFQTFSPGRCELKNSAGWMDLYDHMPYSEPGLRGADLYKIGRIGIAYKSQGYPVSAEAQYIEGNEPSLLEHTKLLNPNKKHRYSSPTYRLFEYDGEMRLQIHPHPTRWYQDNNYTGTETKFIGNDGNLRIYPDVIQIFYTRKPKKPNWAYVVVNNKPLFNATNAVDFDLHASEETELVYRILALAGIAIEKPQLTQTGAQLASAQIQQEKQ